MARVKAFCTERYRVLVVGVRTFDPSHSVPPENYHRGYLPPVTVKVSGLQVTFGLGLGPEIRRPRWQFSMGQMSGGGADVPHSSSAGRCAVGPIQMSPVCRQ